MTPPSRDDAAPDSIPAVCDRTACGFGAEYPDLDAACRAITQHSERTGHCGCAILDAEADAETDPDTATVTVTPMAALTNAAAPPSGATELRTDGGEPLDSVWLRIDKPYEVRLRGEFMAVTALVTWFLSTKHGADIRRVVPVSDPDDDAGPPAVTDPSRTPGPPSQSLDGLVDDIVDTAPVSSDATPMTPDTAANDDAAGLRDLCQEIDTVIDELGGDADPGPHGWDTIDGLPRSAVSAAVADALTQTSEPVTLHVWPPTATHAPSDDWAVTWRPTPAPDTATSARSDGGDTTGDATDPADDATDAERTAPTADAASEWFELPGFGRDLLLAIAAHDDAHVTGRDLRAYLERQYGHDIGWSRLYHRLNDLVDRGLVEKHRVKTLDGRRHDCELTARGRALIAAHRDHVHTATSDDAADGTPTTTDDDDTEDSDTGSELT